MKLSTYFSLGVLILSSVVSAKEVRQYHYSDGHLHYVNFFQETEGMKKLVMDMDNNHVEHAMISGISVVKKWDKDEPQRPPYYMGDDANVYWYSATDVLVAKAVQSLPKSQQARFHPFITGFNPTDLNAAEHIERMLDWDPNFWQGIGEVFARHDDLSALTYGESATADHPAMMKVYRLAAKHHLPVMVHSNITSTRVKEPIYLSEMETAVKKKPKTTFIWAHAGTSASINRRIHLKFLYSEISRMLKTYPNLYIDMSWSLLDNYLLNEDKSPSQEWLELVERYPNRFFIGSDVVGKFDSLGRILQEFNGFLDALPEDVAKKVARDNFLNLLPKRRD